MGLIMYRLSLVISSIYLRVFTLILIPWMYSTRQRGPTQRMLSRGAGREGESEEDCGTSTNAVYDNWFQSNGSDGAAAVM